MDMFLCLNSFFNNQKIYILYLNKLTCFNFLIFNINNDKMDIFVAVVLTICLTMSSGKLLEMEMFGQQYLYFWMKSEIHS